MVKPVHPTNPEASMNVKEDGNVILASDVQPLKASDPIVVTALLSVMPTKALFLNAAGAIVVNLQPGIFKLIFVAVAPVTVALPETLIPLTDLRALHWLNGSESAKVIVEGTVRVVSMVQSANASAATLV